MGQIQLLNHLLSLIIIIIIIIIISSSSSSSYLKPYYWVNFLKLHRNTWQRKMLESIKIYANKWLISNKIISVG